VEAQVSDKPEPYSDSELAALREGRLAAAQQEALRLASEHQYRSPAATFRGEFSRCGCSCGWIEPKENSDGEQNWRDHIQSLLPAAQKASEEHDALLVAGATEAALSTIRTLIAKWKHSEEHAHIEGEFDTEISCARYANVLQGAHDLILKLTDKDSLAALAEFARPHSHPPSRRRRKSERPTMSVLRGRLQ
jgi:hypothetical protein